MKVTFSIKGSYGHASHTEFVQVDCTLKQVPEMHEKVLQWAMDRPGIVMKSLGRLVCRPHSASETIEVAVIEPESAHQAYAKHKRVQTRLTLNPRIGRLLPKE